MAGIPGDHKERKECQGPPQLGEASENGEVNDSKSNCGFKLAYILLGQLSRPLYVLLSLEVSTQLFYFSV